MTLSSIQACGRTVTASARPLRSALRTSVFYFCAVGLFAAGVAPALALEPDKRVLIVGIDGIRTDALAAAKTPQLDRLGEAGLLLEKLSILPDRYTISDTVSHSSWSSILSGTWPDKHRVRTNDWQQANFGRYPHLFVHLKRARPNARTVVITAGPAIADNIPAQSTVKRVERLNAKKSQRAFFLRDERVTNAALDELNANDPTAIFLYFHEPDWVGHDSGFHPTNKSYLRAIENIDLHVGMLATALEERSAASAEDWLIVVCTDHGGLERTHRSGHQYTEITDVFLILSGPSAHRRGAPRDPRIVDIAPTILTHLGVAIDPAWAFDGDAIDIFGAP